jgi:hypothetical protein
LDRLATADRNPHHLPIMRKLAGFLFVTGVCIAAFGQSATPAPKKKPFEGFGNTALDRRPASASSARTAPGATGGTSLDRRPPGMKYAPPRPVISDLPPAGSAAEGSPSTGLSFEAKTIVNGGGVSTEKMANVSSAKAVATTTRALHPVLQVNVRNVGHRAETARLEWFFVGRGVNGGEIFVWDQGGREMPMAAGTMRDEIIESKDLEQQLTTQTRTQSEGVPGTFDRPATTVSRDVSYQFRTGARTSGWIVRMFVEEQLVKVQASSKPLEMMARNSGEFEALLKRQPPPANPPLGVGPPR